jgi:AcrR family transcriptional regulator
VRNQDGILVDNVNSVIITVLTLSWRTPRMPRTPRTQREIDFVKKEILDAALQLIVDDGFHNLSMRRLASRLDMTATSIYYYFSNKDEINLMIRMRGFEMLYQRFEKSCNQHTDPFLKLQAMIRTYFEFGISYPNYYDIMFNLHTPKYLDYVGTELEPVARTEKESSLLNYKITAEIIAELLNNFGNTSYDLVRYKTIQLWCDAHGIISLNNSKLLREIDDKPADLIDRMIEDVIARFMRFGDTQLHASASS